MELGGSRLDEGAIDVTARHAQTEKALVEENNTSGQEKRPWDTERLTVRRGPGQVGQGAPRETPERTLTLERSAPRGHPQRTSSSVRLFSFTLL